jgi:neutral ceramidase
MAALLAGYGERTITPPLGLELSGYGFYLERRAESVRDDLKCRALSLRLGRDRILLISFDLIGFSVPFADALRLAVARELRLPARNVLVACTHTHTGPATQTLPGLGGVDDRYMKTLPRAAKQAAREAAAEARPAVFSFAAEAAEPIGFNRRSGNFEGIDPYLKAAAFVRSDLTVFLLNYACHAVTLGRKPWVSADWPGAAVRAVEARGHKALVLQGFCGDVDPVTNLNRWGEGTEDDLALYGGILAGRAFKAAAAAATGKDPELRAVEKRLRVPLVVPPRDEIGARAALFLEKNGRFPQADRFACEWERTARDRYDELAAKPFVDNVPVQAMAIGGLRLLALPGEAFSAYSLILREGFPSLMTAGYANGNIGYLPSGRAFEDEADYASRFAPMFYTVFPFRPDLPYLLIGAARDLLRGLS